MCFAVIASSNKQQRLKKVHEKIDYMNLCTHETVLTSLHSIYLIRIFSSQVTDKPNIETNDSISHIHKPNKSCTIFMASLFTRFNVSLRSVSSFAANLSISHLLELFIQKKATSLCNRCR